MRLFFFGPIQSHQTPTFDDDPRCSLLAGLFGSRLRNDKMRTFYQASTMMLGDPKRCQADDALLQKWTFIRFVVLGSIMLVRLLKIKAAGVRQEDPPLAKLIFI